MVDKKIQFDIVAGGIPQLKAGLKGVSEAARQAADAFVREEVRKKTAAEKNVAKIQSAYDKFFDKINKENKKSTDAFEKEEKKKTDTINKEEAKRAKEFQRNQEKKLASLKRELDKETAESKKQSAPKQQNWSNVASHAASSGGFYKIGHIIRMANQLGIGSNISKGGSALEEAGSSGAGIGSLGGAAALAGAVLPVAAALGALYVSAKLIEVGFESLSTQAKYLASSFIGAISQIGGAKNIQELIVEGADREKLTKTTRFTVAPDERLSENELQKRSNDISKRADLGAPDSKDVLESQKTIGTLTGRQKTIPKETLEFIAKMAHIGGVSMPQMAETYGQVWAQNKNATPQEIQDMFLSGMAIGQSGAFNVAEIPHAKGLIQAGGTLAGNGLENTKNALAIGTILKPRTGDLELAGTQYQSFIKASTIAHRAGKLNKDTDQFFNENGQITDINGLIANVVATPSMERPKNFGARVETTQFLSNFSRQAGIEDGDTKEQQKQKVLDLLNTYEKLNMSMTDFNQSNIDSTSTQDALRAAFSELNTQLSEDLLAMLKDITPEIVSFIKAVAANKDHFGNAIRLMINGMLLAVPAIIMVAQVLGTLGQMAAATTAIWARGQDATTFGAFHDTFAPIIAASDDFIKSQANLKVGLDGLAESAKAAKAELDNVKVSPTEEKPDRNSPNGVPHEPRHRDHNAPVVRALNNIHNELRNNKPSF